MKTEKTYVKNEDSYWETRDAVEELGADGWESGAISNLRPPTESISIRLPNGLLSQLKGMANKRDVPYQSLIKMILADRVEEEEMRHRLLKKRS